MGNQNNTFSEKGYDKDGLYWANDGRISNIIFSILSFPIVLANYLTE